MGQRSTHYYCAVVPALCYPIAGPRPFVFNPPKLIPAEREREKGVV